MLYKPRIYNFQGTVLGGGRTLLDKVANSEKVIKIQQVPTYKSVQFMKVTCNSGTGEPFFHS